MRRIEITYSTMGQGNPYHVGDRRDYTWNGDPAKSEAARKGGRDGGGSQPETVAQKSRTKRIRRYAELTRDEGKTPREAAKILKVAWSTVRDYEAVLNHDAGEAEAS